VAELVTTAAIHPNVIAGEKPALSPVAPASLSDLDKQHELGQFLTLASDTSPLIPLHRRLFSPDIPHPVCDHPLPLPQARGIIRCGEGDMASLFEIHRSEVRMLDAGAGAGALSAALGLREATILR
jgi:hypothetical protein